MKFYAIFIGNLWQKWTWVASGFINAQSAIVSLWPKGHRFNRNCCTPNCYKGRTIHEADPFRKISCCPACCHGSCLCQPRHGPTWLGRHGRIWGGYGGGFGGASRLQTLRDDREGRIDLERFLADGAIPQLGHGRITLRTMPGTTASDREQATFEAAVVDQLAKAGYDTTGPDGDGGQIVEITVIRDQLEAAEEKRSPISGSATMGVSNRGSMMGLALPMTDAARRADHDQYGNPHPRPRLGQGAL
jgi:hypothetical protein